MAASIENPYWLGWLSSLVVEQDLTPPAAFAPAKFFCLLNDLPLHLLPHREQCALPGERVLFVNPCCSFAPAPILPEEVRESSALLSGFALQGNMAWITNPATGALLPFWLGAELSHSLHQATPGGLEPEGLFPAQRRILLAAGVLVEQNHIARCCAAWTEISARGRDHFRRKGYLTVRDLIHPFHIAALRRYYRQLVRTGKLLLGDSQCPRRYGVHNEPATRFFHHQLAGAISDCVGEKIKPSYVYTGCYLGGAVLEKHTDREQCEFSLSLCLDYSPEPARHTGWPLRLEADGSQISVQQGIGDGLIYMGCKLPHYRDALPSGHTSTSIFFHFVRESFQGSLD
jgi:hypothetical protein